MKKKKKKKVGIFLYVGELILICSQRAGKNLDFCFFCCFNSRIAYLGFSCLFGSVVVLKLIFLCVFFIFFMQFGSWKVLLLVSKGIELFCCEI